MSEWISVEDRLPELYKDVLLLIVYQTFDGGIHIETEEICVGGRDNDSDGDCWFIGNKRMLWDFGFNLDITNDDVTHWMPLPEPPK